MSRFFVLADAARDLHRAIAVLELRSEWSGERFVEAFWETAERIAENPRLAATVQLNWRRETARSRPVAGFPSYVVLYREAARGIEMLRVVPAARN